MLNRHRHGTLTSLLATAVLTACPEPPDVPNPPQSRRGSL